MQIQNKFSPTIDAHGIKVCIVIARFNAEITEGLLESAMSKLYGCKVEETHVTTVHVAGCAEIPYTLQKMAQTKRYDCLIALGCIIKGETPHFDYVCKMVQEGVLRVSLDEHLPIGFGIITANNQNQAIARKSLGSDAALAALELALL